MTTSDSLTLPRPHPIARVTGSAWFWLAFVLLGFGLWLSQIFRYEKPVAPPVMGLVNSFEMTDQLGRVTTDRDLRGRLWIANTISLSDPAEAKAATQAMSNALRKLRLMKELMHAVTFSGDAPVDEVRAFTDARGVDPARWGFLKGTPPLATGDQVLLIDDRFAVRGRYPLNQDGIARLMKDVTLIVSLELASDEADLTRVQRTNTNK